MIRANPPFHAKKQDDGKFVVLDIDRQMLAKGPMSAAKAIEVADEMNQPFLKEKDMELPVSNNPELLTVGLNPRRKKRKSASRRKGGRRRRRNGGSKTVTYRGKRFKGFLALMHKFGKGMARKIWRSKKSKTIGTNPAKRKGKKSNWASLVKRFGVKGAMKHRRSRR